MQIRVKIFFPIILLLFLLTGVAIFLQRNNRIIEKDFVGTTEAINQVDRYSHRLNALQKIVEKALLSYRFDLDPAHLVRVDEAHDGIAKVIAEFGEVIQTKPGELLLDDFVESRRGLEKVESDLLAAVSEGDAGVIERTFKTWEIHDQEMTAALEDLSVYNSKMLELAIRRAAERRKTLINVLSASLAITAVLLALSLVFYGFAIVGPVLQFRRSAEEGVEQAEASLAENETRLAGIIELAVDGIISIDESQKIVLFNDAAQRMFGYLPEEVLGKPVEMLMPEGYRELHRVRVDGFASEAAPRRRMNARSELTCMRKNGEEFASQASISKIATADGWVFTAHVVDLTERKQAEETLSSTEEKLRQGQKMEAIGRLAGGVAHDFNNLLTAINGYSSMLIEDLNPSDPMYHDLDEIRKAGDRAASLTRQLLAFSRKQILQPEVLDLRNTITDMKKMLSRLIGEHIALTVKDDPEIRRVKVDPGQMEQVILNLVINARDAMPKGGRIEIRTDTVEPSGMIDEEEWSVPPGPQVRLSISDNGCGMNDEVRERIFEPFFTTKGELEGTGLGLSTVFGIIKQSGGAIAVESEPGKGSTFHVYLPGVKDADEVGAGEKTSAARTEGSETILLVEDEDIIRNLLKRTLERLGYTVLAASQGGDALLTAERFEGPIDIMVTDVVMPQLSGIELAKRLESIRPQMRVLYVSGYNEEMVADHGLVDRSAHFVQKPFKMKAMAGMIRNVLDTPMPE